MGEIFGALLVAALALCVKLSINDWYAEKQKEIYETQKAVNNNNAAHYPILRQLRQDEMLGRWKSSMYYRPTSYQRYLNEIKSEARKRLVAANVIPNESILDMFFGK